MSRTTQAWDLYDIITDLGCELDERDMLRESGVDPCLDSDGKLLWIRKDTLLWEVLQAYFVHEFDVDETIEFLCNRYGIENIYDEEE